MDMELKIQEYTMPEQILFNYDELKTEIQEKANLYANMVYTDETIKEAKADKAALNKFITLLEDKRKAVKKECLKPYEDFEQKIKELVEIVNEPVQIIDSQIVAYDDKKKQEKLDKIRAYWDEQVHPEWLMCKMIFDKRWLNTTFSLKKVKEAIDERLAKISEEVEAIEKLPEFAFEAMETYKQTLDLSKAIAEGQRLANLQKRKLEAEQKRKEAEAARKAEEAARAEAERKRQEEEAARAETESEIIETPSATQPNERIIDVPPFVTVEVQPEPETEEPQRSWVSFTACLTVDDAVALKNFFQQRNIQYKPV